MLRRINSILVFSVSILFLLGCSTAKIPMSYRFNPRDLKKEITGCWIEVNMHSKANVNPEMELSGELVAIQSDTVYVLTEVQLNGIQLNKINEAILYIYNSQGGKYVAVTGLLYLSDIIAAMATGIPTFLDIGLPWLVGGSIITFSEGNNSNLLIYPKKNTIEDFRKFARFPQGILPGVMKDKLHLILTN
jgi:hypothetical protein